MGAYFCPGGGTLLIHVQPENKMKCDKIYLMSDIQNSKVTIQ